MGIAQPGSAPPEPAPPRELLLDGLELLLLDDQLLPPELRLELPLELPLE